MSNNINLEELPVHQLQAVREQLEGVFMLMQEIKVLTNSFAQLKSAQVTFINNLEALKQIDQAPEAPAMVPLTNSLYVPATLSGSKIMVDVGTGYFIEKVLLLIQNIKTAAEFYKRKADFVKSNLETLQSTVSQRQNQRSVLLEVLQDKLQQLRNESAAGKQVSVE